MTERAPGPPSQGARETTDCYTTHGHDDAFALRWLRSPTATDFDRSLSDLERYVDAVGRPVEIFVVFPQGLRPPSLELVPRFVSALPRLARAARLNVMIMEGRGAWARANLAILQTMALAAGRSGWVYFRTSLEEALFDFPPPTLGLDCAAVLRAFRENGIVGPAR
jgi:hypothetical protein